MLAHPTVPACARTYRRIQANLAVSVSTRVGAQLRVLVGAQGDTTSLGADVLRARFVRPTECVESVRLLALAAYIKSKYSRVCKP